MKFKRLERKNYLFELRAVVLWSQKSHKELILSNLSSVSDMRSYPLIPWRSEKSRLMIYGSLLEY